MTKTSNLPKGITRRADGRYMWRFQMKGRKFCGYARTIKAARIGLKEAKKEASRQQQAEGAVSENANETLDSWFGYWLNSIKVGLKETTKERYRHIYEASLAANAGHKDLTDIDVSAVQHILNELHDCGRTYPYIYSVRTLLTNLLEAAVRHRKIHFNPVPYTEMPTSPSDYNSKDAFTENELTFILERIPTGTVQQICRLAALTGMRIGEILGLTWNDIDFERHEIHICHTLAYYPERGFYLDEPKTRTSRRTLPMLDACAELLTEVRKAENAEYGEKDEEVKQNTAKRKKANEPTEPFTDLVFKTVRGRPFFSCNINKELHKAVISLTEEGILSGERHYSFHSFRHTFASQCLRSGMNPKVLSVILGHSSIRVTMDIYTHVETEDLRRALSKVEAASMQEKSVFRR